MAETGEDAFSISSESVEQSDAANTDFINLTCDPCESDGESKTVVGYCVDCCDFLCEVCYKHHCKPRPSRYHVLQDASQMPKEKVTQKNDENKDGNTKCLVHGDEEITSYCLSHKQLCCKFCVPVGHTLCTNVLDVRDLAKDLTDQEEFKQLTNTLKDLHEKYSRKREHALANIELANNYFTSVTESVSSCLEEVRLTDVNKMKSTIKTCDEVVRQIFGWQAKLENLSERQLDQAFVLMKIVGGQTNRLNDIYAAFRETQTKLVKYAFVSRLPDDEERIIGKILRTPFCARQLNINSEEDRYDCFIRDIALLNKKLLLLTDSSNKKVKLFNVNQNIVVSYLALTETPHRIALTDNNEAFVTIPSWLIRFTSPTTDLNQQQQYQNTERYRAIEWYDNSLLIQCIKPCTVLKLDKNGNHLKTIHNDISKTINDKGKTFIKSPIYSAFNRKTESMVVSCWENNCVVEVFLDGRVKVIAQSELLLRPRGMDFSSDGSLLVCASGRKRIMRIDEAGEIDDYLGEELLFEPTAIRVDTTNSLMYVGGNSQKMLVYQM